MGERAAERVLGHLARRAGQRLADALQQRRLEVALCHSRTAAISITHSPGMPSMRIK